MIYARAAHEPLVLRREGPDLARGLERERERAEERERGGILIIKVVGVRLGAR